MADGRQSWGNHERIKMSFLTAAHNLRVKQLYLDIRDEIPVNSDIKQLLIYISPQINKAFEEGVQYASVLEDKKPPKDIEIDTQPIIIEFALGYQEAAKIRDFKKKERVKKLRLAGVKENKGDEQIKQIDAEYENSINSLVNRAIIAAGNQGEMEVFESNG